MQLIENWNTVSEKANKGEHWEIYNYCATWKSVGYSSSAAFFFSLSQRGICDLTGMFTIMVSGSILYNRSVD